MIPDPIRKKAEAEALKITSFHDFEKEKGLNMEIADTLGPLYRKIEGLEEKNQELEKTNKAIKLIVSPAEERLQEIIGGLESKLAKAVEALKSCVESLDVCLILKSDSNHYATQYRIADINLNQSRQALKEIEGQK